MGKICENNVMFTRESVSAIPEVQKTLACVLSDNSQ